MWDLTSLKMWWEIYGGYARVASLVIVTFIAGWYTGRAMSPYYAAHPIVFEEKGTVAAGTVEGLRDLKAAGTAESSSPLPTFSPSPLASIRFVGSKNSDKYHHPDCPSARQIKTENEVWFNSREHAEAAGYVPSACTKEKLGIK